MKVLLNIETSYSLPADFAEECVQLVTFVLEQENVPDESEVSVTLVDVDEMAEMNREYRGKSGPTDVLSFPCEAPLLGDVIIAPEVAAQQDSDLMDELRLLIVHGVLHLLGYDHEDEADAEAMELRQDALLAEWSAR